MDALCLMFECDERGVLATAGVPWSDEEIARAIGGDLSQTLSCVRELVDKSVISRNSSGAIYSRRMVRDEQKRRLCTEAGKLGGNPELVRHNVTVNRHPKGQAKGRPTPSSSTSSSSSISSSVVAPSALSQHCAPSEMKTPAEQAKLADASRTKRKKSNKRTRTDQEWANHRGFVRVWCDMIWPQTFGGEVYDFQARGGDGLNISSVWGILDFVGQDFDKAVETAKCFAVTFRDSYWRFPCPLAQLRRKMLEFVNLTKLNIQNRGSDANRNTDPYSIPLLNRPLNSTAAAG